MKTAWKFRIIYRIVKSTIFSHNAELKKELLAKLEEIKTDEISDPVKLGECSVSVFELGCKSRSPSVQAVSIGTVLINFFATVLPRVFKFSKFFLRFFEKKSSKISEKSGIFF